MRKSVRRATPPGKDERKINLKDKKAIAGGEIHAT